VDAASCGCGGYIRRCGYRRASVSRTHAFLTHSLRDHHSKENRRESAVVIIGAVDGGDNQRTRGCRTQQSGLPCAPAPVHNGVDTEAARGERQQSFGITPAQRWACVDKRGLSSTSSPMCPQPCPRRRWRAICPSTMYPAPSTALSTCRVDTPALPIHRSYTQSTPLIHRVIHRDGGKWNVRSADLMDVYGARPIGSFAQSRYLSTLFGRLSTAERCSSHPLARAVNRPRQPIQPEYGGLWASSTRPVDKSAERGQLAPRWAGGYGHRSPPQCPASNDRDMNVMNAAVVRRGRAGMYGLIPSADAAAARLSPASPHQAG